MTAASEFNSAAYSAMLGATAAVVRITVGVVSAKTALTRSSWVSTDGTDSGTAIRPACIAPRNATMYSSPCGARMTARSPTAPCCATAIATLSDLRYACAHVRRAGTPAQSCLKLGEKEKKGGCVVGGGGGGGGG